MSLSRNAAELIFDAQKKRPAEKKSDPNGFRMVFHEG
jgi:hypothetical protein